MTQPIYALVLRDGEGRYLITTSTRKQIKTKHGKIAPRFHTLLVSLFALKPEAATIAIVEFQHGMKVQEAAPLLVAIRMDEPGQITYTGLAETEVCR